MDRGLTGRTTMSDTVDAVVFDMNGVLIDSMPMHTGLSRRLLEEAGMELTEEEMLRYMGRGAEDFFHIVKEEKGGDFDPDELSERKLREFVDRVAEIPVMTGAADAIRSLSETYRVGIASNDQRRSVETVLERLDVTDHVDGIATIEAVETGKPDPAIYRVVTDRLDVAPAATVAVEDSPVGVQAARAAGLRAIGFRSSPGVALGDATATVEDMDTLLAQVPRLDGA